MIATAPERFNLIESILGALEHLPPGGILSFEDVQRFSDGCARALAGRLSAAITVCQREAPARLCLRGRRRTNWVARN
jgi:hypothetical protein